MVGNFIPSFSTEWERRKAFTELGHNVIAFQENKTTAADLMEAMGKVDMLTYSHTHDPSYVIDGLKEVFDEYKKNGVPVVTVHLDKWAGLSREQDCGKEATWFASHLFMADCSPEAVELYNRLGVNWYYLRPGVAKDQCYLAQPNNVRFPHEIIFTGSRGYHPEYAFRPKLVDWLKETYGSKFGHYGNDGIRVLREHELNIALASAKIVVGDSCFGGRPNYVSDRYFETRGRGGFLIHPYTDGVDHVGVGDYKKENLSSLKKAIDYYLEHDDEREKKRKQGFEWVRDNETYTHRAEEILRTVFGDEV